MELSFCFVFVSLVLIPVNRALAFSVINSTLETRILFENNSELINGTVSFYPKAKECDCGYSSTGCHLVNGKKVCDCETGNAQDGEECKYCKCGVLAKKCYFKNGEQLCDCRPGSAVSGSSYKTCKWCQCGYRSQKCEFQGHQKVCTCDVGFVESNGNCEACDCGFNSDSCSLSYRGVRKCTCKPGYVAKPASSYTDNEKCFAYSSTSGWKIATYIEGIIFGVIIIGLFVFILGKKNPSL